MSTPTPDATGKVLLTKEPAMKQGPTCREYSLALGADQAKAMGIPMSEELLDDWIKRRDAAKPDATGKVLLTKEQEACKVSGAFYNGIEWFGAWLVDNAEGETVAEELVQQWAVEAWRKHLARSTDTKGTSQC